MKRILLIISLYLCNIEAGEKRKPKDSDMPTRCYSTDQIHILIRELQSLGHGTIESEVMARQAEVMRVARERSKDKKSKPH